MFAVLLTAVSASADVRLVSHELPNGLRVVLAPAVTSPVTSSVTLSNVAIQIAFDGGSRQDAKAGTAWLANRIIAARLPRIEAGVNQERAYLAAEVSLADLPKELARIAAALANRAVTDEEFAKTRDLLVREARERGTAESSRVLLRRAYGPDGRNHESEVAPESVSRDDVQSFLRAHYAMRSAALAIAGTFDEAQVMSAVRSAFAPLAAGDAQRPCSVQPRQLKSEERQIIADANMAESDVLIAYLTPQSTDRDWYALNILADIVGQGEGSRVRSGLTAAGLNARFGEGMTESPCGSTLFKMRARFNADVAASKVEAVIDEQLARLSRDLVSDEELALARKQEQEWAASQLASASGTANSMARVTLFYRDPERVNREVAAMQAVTAEDVRRVARQYLRKENRVVVVTAREPASTSSHTTPRRTAAPDRR